MFRILLFCILPLSVWAEERRLSMLAEPPNWTELEVFQNTLTREEFEERMDTLYAPYADWRSWFAVSASGVAVVMDSARPSHRYFISFASSSPESAKTAPLHWEGLHVALDPGHIGGRFGLQEHRHFQVGDSLPVQEGDLVLAVARRIQEALEKKGARVSLIRDRPEPVTPKRPEDFREEAERLIGFDFPELKPGTKEWERTVQGRQNLLFYRVSEIRTRALLGNEIVQPDLVLALHFNADAWPDEEEQTLVEKSHFHLLVNGAYLDSELALNDVRFALSRKIFSRDWEMEKALAVPLIEAFQEATGLPPFIYSGKNAVPLLENPYLYGRNLMANRLYEAPVLFLEPYVANSEADFARIQEYLEAEKTGEPLESSIVEEYVEAVLSGIGKWIETAQ